MIAVFQIAVLAIGRGPATLNVFGRVVVLILGIVFVAGAFSPDVRLRGAFMHGKGPSVPIGSAGRVILFLVSLVMFYLAVWG